VPKCPAKREKRPKMGTCYSNPFSSEVVIDFENAKPTDDEIKLSKEAEELQRDSKTVLQLIEDYKGCRELVRRAMSEPSRESEQEAFEGLLKAVDSISFFFEYARKIENTLPLIYSLLAPARPRDDGKHPLAVYQASGRYLATILDVTITFDQIRMMRPNLSNDFSYYRRLLPKFQKHPDVKIKDDEASGMALFTAEHMPMMSIIVKTTKHYCETNDSQPSVADLLSTMANSCMGLAKYKKFSSPELNLFCARAMTGSIVLYDHLEGKVFSKKSPVAIRECIHVLKNFDKKDSEGLLNAIRYSTVSFRIAPESIQALLE